MPSSPRRAGSRNQRLTGSQHRRERVQRLLHAREAAQRAIELDRIAAVRAASTKRRQVERLPRHVDEPLAHEDEVVRPRGGFQRPQRPGERLGGRRQRRPVGRRSGGCRWRCTQIIRSSVPSSGDSSAPIASMATAADPLQPREQHAALPASIDQGEAAGAERDAHAEQRGQRADLQLAERRQADGHHPGAAGPAAQVVRHAELQEALREQIGQGAGRVHDDQHDQHADQADQVRRRAEDDQAGAEGHAAPQTNSAPPTAGAAQRGGGQSQDAADRAGGVEGAEPLGADVENIAGEARQQRLVREAQHLGAGR